jgi:hypothetical protein
VPLLGCLAERTARGVGGGNKASGRAFLNNPRGGLGSVGARRPDCFGSWLKIAHLGDALRPPEYYNLVIVKPDTL